MRENDKVLKEIVVVGLKIPKPPEKKLKSKWQRGYLDLDTMAWVDES